MGSEIARLMAIKHELQKTTNTAGFSYIRQIADNIVAVAVNEALEEEDKQKREDKVLKASALKKGFRDLWNAVENAKAIDPDTDFGTGFEEIDSNAKADA